MSTHRSTSGQGIRELRARFEHQTDQNLSPSRAHSPPDARTHSCSSSRSPSRRQNITTSFISVPSHMPSTMPTDGTSPEDKAASISKRRPSFSMSTEHDAEAINHIKQTVSNEAERRKSIPNTQHDVVPETVLFSAMPTPVPEATEPPSPGLSPARPDTQPVPVSDNLTKLSLPTREKQTEHTEKPTSAVEDEEAELRPADLTANSTLDNAFVLPSVGGQTMQGQKEVRREQSNTKRSEKTSRKSVAIADKTARPSNNTTSAVRSTAASSARASLAPAPTRHNAPSKATASTTASTNRSSLSSKSSSQGQQASPTSKTRPKPPTQTVPLPSHLTAPTASSKAKHDDQYQTSKRVTSASRPIGETSHLMAPTASSKAKHDSEAESLSAAARRPPVPAATKRDRTSTASSTSRLAHKPSSRQSLIGHLNSAASRNPPARPAASVSKTPAPGFLDRMMKPTAASSSKIHDKPEQAEQAEKKTPPTSPQHSKRTAPASTSHKSQVNGSTTKPALSNGVSKPAATRGSTNPAAISGPEKSATISGTSKTAANNGVTKPVVTNGTSKPTATSAPPKTVTTNGKARPPVPNVITKQSASSIELANGTPKSAKSAVSSLPSSAESKVAKQPSTPVATSTAAKARVTAAPAEQSATPIQPAAMPADGTEDDQQPWNAACLPLTPQSQKSASPMDNIEVVNGNSAKSSDSIHARRSLMETPDLLGTTIH